MFWSYGNWPMLAYYYKHRKPLLTLDLIMLKVTSCVKNRGRERRPAWCTAFGDGRANKSARWPASSAKPLYHLQTLQLYRPLDHSVSLWVVESLVVSRSHRAWFNKTGRPRSCTTSRTIKNLILASYNFPTSKSRILRKSKVRGSTSEKCLWFLDWLLVVSFEL